MKNYMAVIVLLFAGNAFAAAQDLRCMGTEPFWNAKITGDKIIVAAPGEKDQSYKITLRTSPIGVPESFGEVLKGKGAAGDVTITVRADEKCTDGMSDATYSKEIWLLQNDQLVVGCCK
ncbi:COG3650 family protein [Bdellovibrio sp. NC01]|uniref:COG3650 family protein n=1 Tax=Bdellovibrio sp. NC01 TaxID=2220073 RepID=UPI001158D2BC|nr:hypothetical protein [Bdellovibrio sp. NC01]QDK38340.1 hypothetical protein DOE51_12495 [Bdellovibrio sp. NC01]